MAWIKIIPEHNAGWELTKVYEQIKAKRGKLSNIMMVHSLNPGAMQSHMDLYLSIMFHRSGIRRDIREMIAVVVSQVNQCDYCINHHLEALNFYWRDRERLKKFKKDYHSCDLPEKTITALSYAEKLTRHPQETNEQDVAELRSAGYRDEEILDINLIAGYFNFVTRVANGLGVEFTEDEVRGYKY
jgi:uncharacterized peroxidase-related enzyme